MYPAVESVAARTFVRATSGANHGQDAFRRLTTGVGTRAVPGRQDRRPSLKDAEDTEDTAVYAPQGVRVRPRKVVMNPQTHRERDTNKV